MTQMKECFNPLCEKLHKNNKFCSRSCSNSVSNANRVPSQSHKHKTKLKLLQKHHPELSIYSNWLDIPLDIRVKYETPKLENCKNCGKNISQKYNSKYCNNQCQQEYLWKQRIELIVKDEPHPKVTARNIKRYLLEIDPHCQECGIPEEYNGKPITLELDHIDGDSSRHIISNCRLLCPNCHSQTDTYRAKNTGNPLGEDNRRQRYLSNMKVSN